MQIKTQGFEITGVAGTEKITIRPVGQGADAYVETVVTFVSINKGISFDLDGLRDFLAGVVQAERQATILDRELRDNLEDQA